MVATGLPYGPMVARTHAGLVHPLQSHDGIAVLLNHVSSTVTITVDATGGGRRGREVAVLVLLLVSFLSIDEVRPRHLQGLRARMVSIETGVDEGLVEDALDRVVGASRCRRRQISGVLQLLLLLEHRRYRANVARHRILEASPP